MVLGRLTYFLEQHSILSPVQAGFRPNRSIVDQVLLSQSIADSCHQSKPGAHTVLGTVDFAKAFDSVWHSALLSKLLSLGLLVLSNRYDLISQIAVRKSASVIPIVVLSVSEVVFPKVQFLDQFFSLYLSMIFPPFSLHPLRFHSMQMTLPFGPLPQVLSVQLPQHKLPSTD